ncbi:uncharacterized protein [Panulirus ornatus]|uniref:uncharacterized protein n=1 Tax=Panulirus ornatus TaxID=150431 RepID=UPI003A88D689
MAKWAWSCGRDVVTSCWTARVVTSSFVVVVCFCMAILWLVRPDEPVFPEGSEPSAAHENMTLSLLSLPLQPSQKDAELWLWAALVSVGVVAVFPRVGVCTKIVVMATLSAAHASALILHGEHNFLHTFFIHYYHRLPGVEWWVVVGVQVVVLVGVLGVLGGQSEERARTHYTWASRVAVEQEDVEVCRSINKILLENLLPAYLAHRFLVSSNTPQELYHERYSGVGVMFASIPNYKEFYDETDVNKQGLECLRLLNEIICDYDKLLTKPKYSMVEKIKTIGSTYMVAAGLHPGKEEARDRTERCLVLLVEFALALAAVLDAINKESFQSFKLRVGLAHGPVIAGVVGAQKPQYDIWGNTVNVASRMDSTGLMGRIQVTEETAAILQGAGWACECRGPTPIKGKGTLITYFVSTPYDPPSSELRSTTSSYALRPDERALLRQVAPGTSTENSLLVTGPSQVQQEPQFSSALPSSSDETHGDSSCSSQTTIRVLAEMSNSQELSDSSVNDSNCCSQVSADALPTEDANSVKKVIVTVKDTITSSSVIRENRKGIPSNGTLISDPGKDTIKNKHDIPCKNQRIESASYSKVEPFRQANSPICTSPGGCGEGGNDMSDETGVEQVGNPTEPLQGEGHLLHTNDNLEDARDLQSSHFSANAYHINPATQAQPSPQNPSVVPHQPFNMNTRGKITKQVTLDYNLPKETQRVNRLPHQPFSFESTHLTSSHSPKRGKECLGSSNVTDQNSTQQLDECEVPESSTEERPECNDDLPHKLKCEYFTSKYAGNQNKGGSKTDNSVGNSFIVVDTRDFNEQCISLVDECTDIIENGHEMNTSGKLLKKCNIYENPVDGLQKNKVLNKASKTEMVKSQNECFKNTQDNYDERESCETNSCKLPSESSSLLPKMRRGKSVDTCTSTDKTKKVDTNRRISLVNFINERESDTSDSLAKLGKTEIVSSAEEPQVSTSIGKKVAAFTSGGLARKQNHVFV